jgi:DNA-binding transcriptional LysR family regulator
VGFRSTFPSLELTRQGLADGRIDLAVGYLPGLEAGIHRREMFMQRYVCVMRTGHPLERKKLGLADLKRAEYLMVEYVGTGHSALERELREAGIIRRVRLRIPQYLSAPHVVATTDLLWIVPDMLARILAEKFGLTIKPCPLPLPAFAVAVYWHDRFHRDPANQWLRQQFVDAFDRM